MDYAWKLRNAFIESTRGYFATTSDVVVSDNDLPYYDGEDFFDKKHRLNVHYHASLSTSVTAAVASGSTAEEGAPPVAAEVVQEAELRPAPQKLPVVVFIHGGGWKRGDRNYICDAYNNFGKAVAAEGFVVVVPSYRWSMAIDGGVQHPKHAHDLAYALRWVKENIGRYNGDVDTVFLSGHSAGGHLAALLALDTRYLGDVGIEPEFVKGVVGICGVYDLVTGYSRFLLRTLYLADAFGHDQEVLKEASPVYHTRSNAPPFILFNAAMDFGLENDALLLRALLTKAGNSVAHRSFPGTNHGSIIGLGPAWGRPYEPLVRETCVWLKKQVAAMRHSATADEHAEEAVEEETDRSDPRDLLYDAVTSMTETVAEACTDNKPLMVLRDYGWE